VDRSRSLTVGLTFRLALGDLPLLLVVDPA